MDFADQAKPKESDPSILSDAELSELYLKIPIIEIWINKVQEYMLDAAIKGKEFPDLKLVEGRSVRMWQDTSKVEDILKKNGLTEEQIYTQKIQGIGAVEKILGKPKFAELLSAVVVKPQGKPSLVHISDKREALGIASAKNDFAD